MKAKKQRCGYKRRFRDKAEAIHALWRIENAEPPRQKRPVRAYPCPRCKGWHLTSKPLSTGADEEKPHGEEEKG